MVHLISLQYSLYCHILVLLGSLVYFLSIFLSIHLSVSLICHNHILCHNLSVCLSTHFSVSLLPCLPLFFIKLERTIIFFGIKAIWSYARTYNSWLLFGTLCKKHEGGITFSELVTFSNLKKCRLTFANCQLRRYLVKGSFMR